MVSAVSNTMGNFRNYSMASQTQMESIRDQMKEIRDKAQKKMSRPYDPNQGMHTGFLVFC